MVKFLTTKGIIKEIEKIIQDADKEIMILSPFLDMDSRIVEALSDAVKAKKELKVIIVYGKGKLPAKEKKKLKKIEKSALKEMNIELYYRENLHAKCYMNEYSALVTSMNLYESSQTKNDEFGIQILPGEEKEVYDSIKKAIKKIIENSEKELEAEEGKQGHCIRCGKEIELDPLTPYCKSCYVSWAKYKNPDYEEKYCHICGKPYKSTMNKPVCKACWTKYKGKLNFPGAKQKK